MCNFLVILVIPTLVFSSIFMLIGKNIATSRIIADRKVCVSTTSNGVDFEKCFILVEEKAEGQTYEIDRHIPM